MNSIDRQREIFNLIQREKTVEVNKLARSFGV